MHVVCTLSPLSFFPFAVNSNALPSFLTHSNVISRKYRAASRPRIAADGAAASESVENFDSFFTVEVFPNHHGYRKVHNQLTR